MLAVTKKKRGNNTSCMSCIQYLIYNEQEREVGEKGAKRNRERERGREREREREEI